MSTKDVKVGDPIVVECSRYRPSDPARTKRGTVIKVARKYFTVEFVEHYEWSNEQRERRSTDEFEIANGVQRGDPNYTNYRDHAYTPAGYGEAVYARTIDQKLRTDHRVYGGNFDSTLQIERLTLLERMELLAFLDRVKARREQKDLDA